MKLIILKDTRYLSSIIYNITSQKYLDQYSRKKKLREKQIPNNRVIAIETKGTKYSFE